MDGTYKFMSIHKQTKAVEFYKNQSSLCKRFNVNASWLSKYLSGKIPLYSDVLMSFNEYELYVLTHVDDYIEGNKRRIRI